MANDKITPSNLIPALDGKEPNIFIGAWSRYGLASMALPHYFPDKYKDDNSPLTSEEANLIAEIGCNCWEDVVEKYHSEVGYTQEMLDNTAVVNEY